MLSLAKIIPHKYSTRVWLALSLIYLLSATVIIWILLSGFKNNFIRLAEQDMKNRHELVGLETQYFINTIEKHAEVLSRSPEIRDYINCCVAVPSSDSTDKLQVALLFKALLRTYPQYFQARIIDVGTGKEMIRVNKDDQSIRVVPESELQIKKDREYFVASLKLEPNEFYLSAFDLNRERGQLTIPTIKTIRVATPLTDSSGSKLAILIINVNTSYWFDRLNSYQSDMDSLFLLDEKGNFLFHPDDPKSFASYKVGFDPAFNAFDEMIIARNATTSDGFQINEIDGEDFYVLSRTYSFGKTNPRMITTVGSLPKNLLFSEVRSKINSAILLVMGALLVGISLLYVLAKTLVQPVSKLSKHVKLYTPGTSFPKF